MGRLLDDEKFWEIYWNFRLNDYDTRVVESEHQGSSNESQKSSLMGKLFEYGSRNYHDYLLWEVIYRKFMPEAKGAKILEIGSAPGGHLVRLSKRFGFIPYGIEHSERGVVLNREVFRSHNINPDNVIYADFFSEEFQKNYRGSFDIVISRGFVEDFPHMDAESIIAQHINLLSENGYLFVTIPNFRGIYYVWARLFDNELLTNANTDIMQKEKFSMLFNGKGLSPLFCGYYGTFNCGDDRFSPSVNSPVMRLALFLFTSVQRIANVLFRVALRERGMESALFSPYLIYIGAKK